jgi:hypothetical protein
MSGAQTLSARNLFEGCREAAATDPIASIRRAMRRTQNLQSAAKAPTRGQGEVIWGKDPE